jgi:hypothetical protein
MTTLDPVWPCLIPAIRRLRHGPDVRIPRALAWLPGVVSFKMGTGPTARRLLPCIRVPAHPRLKQHSVVTGTLTSFSANFSVPEIVPC